MPRIIGLTAQKGVGKSTLANMLVEEIPGAEIIAFADQLKDDVFDLLVNAVREQSPQARSIPSREWLEERKSSVFGPLCQGYGEFARQYWGDDYWIKVVADYTSQFLDEDTFIIPDVRYLNEVEWIKSQGGLLVSIVGPLRWEGDQRDADHPSEANVPACQKRADVVVSNIHDLDYLRQQAKAVANRATSLVKP